MAYKFYIPRVNNKFTLHGYHNLPRDNRPFYNTGNTTESYVNYIVLSNELHQWFLDNKVEYKIEYCSNISECKYFYFIEIEDKSNAMLFKLTFGGSI